MAKKYELEKAYEDLFQLLSDCRNNIKLIDEKYSAKLPEYENMYLYTFSTILLLNFPCKKVNEDIEITYKERSFKIADERISSLIKDKYAHLNFDGKIKKEVIANTKEDNSTQNEEEKISGYTIIEEIEEISSKENVDEITEKGQTEDYSFKDEFKQIEQQSLEEENLPSVTTSIKESEETQFQEVKKEKVYVEDSNPYMRSIKNFIFNKHAIEIRDVNGLTFKFNIIVYPLNYDEDKRPVKVFAAIERNGRIKIAYTSNKTNSRTIELVFDEYSFLINGRWDSGKFISTIMEGTNKISIISNELIENNYENYPVDFGKVIYEGDIKLEFFPLDMQNNGYTGLTPSAVIVINEEKEEVFLPEDNYISIVMPNKYIRFETYWLGGEYVVSPDNVKN